MAGADEGSRIRDVVRGSKIRLDILRKLDRQLGSFNSELNQGTIGIQNCSKQYQTHGRVLPRSAKGVEDCIYVGRLEQNRSLTAGSDRRSHLQEANRRWVRSYLPLFKRTSNKEDLFEWFDTVDCFFEETQPLENTKCELASYVLEDEAEQWWQQLQHRRRLDGESEIKLWPWMKFLLSNDFWPAACSIKGSPEVEISSKVVNYRHNIPDEEERKAGCEYDAEAHNNNDEIAMEKTDKFTPTKCSTNYLSNIHLEKSVYMGSTELYNSVSDYSIRLAHGAEGCVKQVEEEKKSSESCHEGDSHGKELDEELENRGLKAAKCSMKVPSQFNSNEQAKFGCCDSKAEFHYPGPISDDAYKTHVCEDVLGHDVLGHDVLGHDVLIDEKQTQVGKTNEEGDKVVGKETSKKYVLNDVDSLVLPTRGTSLPLSIAKGPEVGETRLELIYRVLGILHEPLKSIWTYQLDLARNPPLQDHWSCTFVGMEFTWGSIRSKKHAAHSLLLPSMLETCSARDVFLFDPGGYIHLSDNWGLSNYLLSSPNGLASSLIGTLTLSLLSSGVINSTRKATKSIEFQGCLAGKEKNIGAWSSNIRREIEFAQSSVLGLCLLLKVLHQFLTPKKISNGNNNIVVLEEIYDGCRAAVELLVKTHHDVASSTLNAFDQHPNRWHGMEYDQNFIYLSRPHCDCSLHALLLIYTASNGGITSVGECTKCNGDHSVHLGLNVKNRVEFDLWKPHGYSSAHLLKFTRDIIHGIDHLHEFGIVHGNLSHQNIHRSRSKERNNCNKIFDMGISKRFAVSIMSLTKHGSGYGRLTVTEDRTVDFPYSIII